MNDCAIIRDLLPLYAEDICSDSSKEMVSEHLKGCNSCQTALTAMKTEVIQKAPLQEADPLQKLGKKLKKERSKAFKRGIAITLAVLVLIPLILAKGIGTAELRRRLENEQQGNVFKTVHLEPAKKGSQNFEGVKFTLPDKMKLRQSKTSVYYANADESVRLIISDATDVYPYAAVTANHPFLTDKRIAGFMEARSLVTMPELMHYCRTYDGSGLNFFSGFSKFKESLFVYHISESIIPVCDSLYWVEGLGFDCVVVNFSTENLHEKEKVTYDMATVSDGIRTWSVCLIYNTDSALTDTLYDILRSVSFDY